MKRGTVSKDAGSALDPPRGMGACGVGPRGHLRAARFGATAAVDRTGSAVIADKAAARTAWRGSRPSLAARR